jgi:F-type H+-transporting ATPase subunit delta
MERTPEAYTRGILAAALEPWLEGLSAVSAALAANTNLRERLDNPVLELPAKLALLEGILPDGATNELRNFLSILLSNHDLGQLDGIVNALEKVMSAEAGGPQQAVVTSAVALTEEEQAQVKARLADRFGSNLKFSFVVDSEILGGLIVQVGDKLIDDSVRGRLNALRQKIGV